MITYTIRVILHARIGLCRDGVRDYASVRHLTSLAVQFYVGLCSKSSTLAAPLVVASACVSHCRLSDNDNRMTDKTV